MDSARRSWGSGGNPDRRTVPRKFRELRTLAAIGEAVSRSARVEDTYERVARAVWGVLPFDRFSIASMNEREGQTDVFVLDRRLPQWRKGETYRLRGPLAAEVIEDGRIDQLLAQLVEPNRRPANLTFPERFPSMLRVPIEIHGRSIGSLALRSERPRAYHRKDLTFARQIAAKLGPTLEYFRVAMESSQIQERAETRRRLQPAALRSVSERLQSPLIAAQTAASVIASLEPDEDSETRSRAIGILNRSLERLGYVTQRMGEFASLATLDRPMTFQPVDLGPLLRRLVDDRSAERASRHVSAGSMDHERDIVAYGDPAQLQRLFTEVVDNAHRYTSDGGWIRIGARHEGAWLIVEIANSTEPTLAITSDSGSPRPAATDTPRSGLGLCMADAILRAYGGELLVQPGNGFFRIQVRLPSLSTFRSSSGTPRARSTAAKHGKERVAGVVAATSGTSERIE